MRYTCGIFAAPASKWTLAGPNRRERERERQETCDGCEELCAAGVYLTLLHELEVLIRFAYTLHSLYTRIAFAFAQNTQFMRRAEVVGMVLVLSLMPIIHFMQYPHVCIERMFRATVTSRLHHFRLSGPGAFETATEHIYIHMYIVYILDLWVYVLVCVLCDRLRRRHRHQRSTDTPKPQQDTTVTARNDQ